MQYRLLLVGQASKHSAIEEAVLRRGGSDFSGYRGWMERASDSNVLCSETVDGERRSGRGRNKAELEIRLLISSL